MSDNVRDAVDWNSIAADAARFGRGGASIVAKRAREREAELLAALAAPSSESPAATGSGAAPTRDAVAEVLLHEAHPDLAPWSLLQLSGHNSAGLVCAVALARRQADAILSRWSAPPAPRGEAVAWGVMGTAGLVTDYTGCPCAFRNEADAREALDEWLRASSTLSAHYRVVALVPQHEEPAT